MGAFDDLIPESKTSGSFDDLIPKEDKGALESYYDTGTDVARSFAKGLVPFAEEAEAGLQSLGEKGVVNPIRRLRGAPEVDSSFSGNLSEIEQSNKKFSQDNPVSSVALNIGGALASGGPLATRLGLGTGTMAQKVLKNLAFASGAGALYGASENKEDRLGGAGTGATVAGVLGAGATALAPLVGSVAGKAASSLKGVSNLFRNVSKEEVVASALGDKALKLAQTKLPDGSRLIDLPELHGLGRTIVKRGGEAGNLIEETLDADSLANPERFQKLIDDSFIDPYLNKVNTLKTQKKEAGSKLYEAFVNNNNTPIESDALNKLNELPVFQEVIDKAKSSIARFGGEIPKEGISLKVGDTAKKILDDQIASAYQGGEKFLGNQLNTVKNNLVSVLKKEVPGYEDALDLYGQALKLDVAEEQGAKFLRQPLEEAKDLIKGYSNEEKQALQIGLGRQILESTKRSNTPANRLLNPQDQAKIRMLFDKPEDYNKFINGLQKERAGYKTQARVTGGSRTDINVAKGNQVVEGAIDFALNPKTKLISMIVDPVKAKASGLTEKNIKDVANLLLSEGFDASKISAIAQKTNTSPQTVQSIFNKLKPATTQQGAKKD